MRRLRMRSNGQQDGSCACLPNCQGIKCVNSQEPQHSGLTAAVTVDHIHQPLVFRRKLHVLHRLRCRDHCDPSQEQRAEYHYRPEHTASCVCRAIAASPVPVTYDYGSARSSAAPLSRGRAPVPSAGCGVGAFSRSRASRIQLARIPPSIDPRRRLGGSVWRMQS